MWRPAEYVIATLLALSLLAWGATALVWFAGGFC